MEILELISSYAVTIAVKLVTAAFVFFVGKYLVKGLISLFSKSKLGKSMNEAASGFIKNALSIVLNVVLVLTVAAVLGVPMSSIIALLGSAGLAIGLALQGGLSNFAGGIILLIFKPFDVGDYIVCGTDEGTVSSVGIFYTTLVTPDSRRIVLPNSNVTSSSIINVSVEGKRRLDLEISIANASDIDKALITLTDKLAVDDRVNPEKPPFAAVTGYSSGCFTLSLRMWCSTGDYWNLKFDLLKKLPALFAEEGIALARPVLDVTTK